MYSRENVGPRMEPWETPALAEYYYEDFPPEQPEAVCYLKKKKKKTKYLT